MENGGLGMSGKEGFRVGKSGWKRAWKICPEAMLRSKCPLDPGGVCELLEEIETGVQPYFPAAQDHL